MQLASSECPVTLLYAPNNKVLLTNKYVLRKTVSNHNAVEVVFQPFNFTCQLDRMFFPRIGLSKSRCVRSVTASSW